MITHKHKQIISLLKKNPYLSQQKIADEIGLSRSATANMISQLVSAGYIVGRAYVLNDSLNELIVCIGASNIDHKLIAQETVGYHTSNPVASEVSMGGVMRNIAENCGRLGINVSLLSIVGDDQMGDMIINQSQDIFRSNKIDRHPHKPTGSYYAILDQDRDLILGLADMDISEDMDEHWIIKHKDHLRHASMLIIDMNVQKSCLQKTVDIARAESIPLMIVGVSGPKINRMPDGFKDVDYGIFNLDESQSYFKSNADSQTLAKMWIEAGFQEVIITNSTNDVVYASRKQVLSFPVKASKNVVDVTGAGDSFVSGIVYGISINKSVINSIPFGLANASLTIQKPTSVNNQLTRKALEAEIRRLK